MAERRNDEHTISPVGMEDRYRDDMSPVEIEEEIEYTRGRVDETLNAIQEKLSPGGLIDQAIEYIRETPGKYASRLAKTIILNPVPSALIGAGIAWFAVSKSGGASYSDTYVAKARNTLHRFRKSAGDRADMHAEIGGDYPARRGVFSFFWEEQPLLNAVIGFSVGAVLGAVVPETRFEHESMDDFEI
jgi:hypothetical protein